MSGTCFSLVTRLPLATTDEASLEGLDTRSPDADLSKAAMDALQQRRFQPGTLNEQPVEVAVMIEVGFRSY